MPELALNDDQRDPLARHLDRVRVPQLVLVPTSAQAPLSPPVIWVFTTSTYGAFGGSQPANMFTMSSTSTTSAKTPAAAFALELT